MSLVDLYPWLKALHVAAALAFFGGALAVSLFLAAVPLGTTSIAPIAQGLHRWDQNVTTPAMLVVWALGLILASTGHWLADGWLQTKLLFVIILSGMHGVQSARLRRLAGGASLTPSRTAPWLVGCAIGVAMLAVAKPF